MVPPTWRLGEAEPLEHAEHPAVPADAERTRACTRDATASSGDDRGHEVRELADAADVADSAACWRALGRDCRRPPGLSVANASGSCLARRRTDADRRLGDLGCRLRDEAGGDDGTASGAGFEGVVDDGRADDRHLDTWLREESVVTVNRVADRQAELAQRQRHRRAISRSVAGGRPSSIGRASHIDGTRPRHLREREEGLDPGLLAVADRHPDAHDRRAADDRLAQLRIRPDGEDVVFGVEARRNRQVPRCAVAVRRGRQVVVAGDETHGGHEAHDRGAHTEQCRPHLDPNRGCQCGPGAARRWVPAAGPGCGTVAAEARVGGRGGGPGRARVGPTRRLRRRAQPRRSPRARPADRWRTRCRSRLVGPLRWDRVGRGVRRCSRRSPRRGARSPRLEASAVAPASRAS